MTTDTPSAKPAKRRAAARPATKPTKRKAAAPAKRKVAAKSAAKPVKRKVAAKSAIKPVKRRAAAKPAVKPAPKSFDENLSASIEEEKSRFSFVDPADARDVPVEGLVSGIGTLIGRTADGLIGAASGIDLPRVKLPAVKLPEIAMPEFASGDVAVEDLGEGVVNLFRRGPVGEVAADISATAARLAAKVSKAGAAVVKGLKVSMG
jgi:hypothetical protein